MTQDEAIAHVEGWLGKEWMTPFECCTGDWSTCEIDECYVCSVRDCPHHEMLHYFHDGCPACEPA